MANDERTNILFRDDKNRQSKRKKTPREGVKALELFYFMAGKGR
jgi:hypothetical protein